MINRQLIINNYTRDFFQDEYTDTFELVPVEGDHHDYYEFKHNGAEVAKLSNAQLCELVEYLKEHIK